MLTAFKIPVAVHSLGLTFYVGVTSRDLPLKKGWMTFTRIPRPLTVAATERANPSTACLLAVYIGAPGIQLQDA